VAGLGGAASRSVPERTHLGMTNGYGYIALAIMIFGAGAPTGHSWRLSFSVTIALSANLNIYLSQLVIPQQFISMLPTDRSRRWRDSSEGYAAAADAYLSAAIATLTTEGGTALSHARRARAVREEWSRLTRPGSPCDKTRSIP